MKSFNNLGNKVQFCKIIVVNHEMQAKGWKLVP